jgi:hypothetical protein
MSSSSYLYNKYKCINCSREYTRKSYYDKHSLICDFLSKSVKEHKIDVQEYDDTPNQRQLYEVILELSAKIVKMEEKISELSKNAEYKRKKINIIEWLNNSIKCNINFNQWIENIKINRKHLELIFNNDYNNGIVHILKDIIHIGELDHNNNEILLPMKSFDQKPNMIYIHNDGQWNIMNNEMLNKLTGTFTKLLLGEFINWQKENMEKLENDDRFGIEYAQNMKKIIGHNLSVDQINNKIKNEIYKILKVNLKSVVEYEFT